MKRSELMLLLENEDIVIKDGMGKKKLNQVDVYKKLKYFYRRLKISELGFGRYQVCGKKGFQIIIEEV